MIVSTWRGSAQETQHSTKWNKSEPRWGSFIRTSRSSVSRRIMFCTCLDSSSSSSNELSLSSLLARKRQFSIEVKFDTFDNSGDESEVEISKNSWTRPHACATGFEYTGEYSNDVQRPSKLARRACDQYQAGPFKRRASFRRKMFRPMLIVRFFGKVYHVASRVAFRTKDTKNRSLRLFTW